MSDVMNCPTCNATCRIVGRETDGLPRLQAFQNIGAENKIAQLKKSVMVFQNFCQDAASEIKAIRQRLRQRYSET